MKSRAFKVSVWGIAGTILTIVGIAGVPDNLSVWQRWFEKSLQFVNHTPVRVLIALCGVVSVGMAVYIVVAPKRFIKSRWRKAFFGRVLHNVGFEDTPTRPMWHLFCQGEEPKYDLIDIRHLEYIHRDSALHIIPNGTYAIDHNFAASQTRARIARWVVLHSFEPANARLYLRLRVRFADGTINDKVWLTITIFGKNEPVQLSPTEWEIGIIPRAIDDRWVSVDVDIQNAFSETFGKQDVNLIGVNGLRVRGDVTLANIEIRGRNPLHKAMRGFVSEILVHQPLKTDGFVG